MTITLGDAAQVFYAYFPFGHTEYYKDVLKGRGLTKLVIFIV